MLHCHEVFDANGVSYSQGPLSGCAHSLCDRRRPRPELRQHQQNGDTTWRLAGEDLGDRATSAPSHGPCQEPLM